MRYFLSDDDRQAQRLSRDSELCSLAVLISGAQEASGHATSAAYKRNLLSEYARRHTFSSGPRSAGYVSRLLGVLARLVRLAPLMAGLALLLAPICSQAQTTLGTQTLNLTLNAAAFLYSVPTSVTLNSSGSVFNNYTNNITMTYRARTGTSVTTAGITVKATADFSPSGQGLSIGTSGGPLTYTCSGTSGNGFTPCPGSLTVSTSTSTNVVSIGASACTGGASPCSGFNPDTVTVYFTLTNKPSYKTGAYSATLTWTISAT